MSVIHELFGIQSEELETLKLEYAKLIDLTRRLKSGEIELDAITVGDNCWSIEESPAEDS